MRARTATGEREGGRGIEPANTEAGGSQPEADRGQAPGEAGTHSSGSESDMPSPTSGQPSLHLSSGHPTPSLSLWDLAGGLVSGQLGLWEDGEPGSAAL